MFPSIAAVALAGLYDVPAAVASRSVIVRMRRRGPEASVELVRLRIHEPQGLEIGGQVGAVLEELRVVADPGLPAGVTDRPADAWEPLLAIAQAVGGQWPGQLSRLVCTSWTGIRACEIRQ